MVGANTFEVADVTDVDVGGNLIELARLSHGTGVCPTLDLPSPGVRWWNSELTKGSILSAVVSGLVRGALGGLQMGSGDELTECGEGLAVGKLYIALDVSGSSGRRNLSAGDAVLPSESVKPGVQGVVVVQGKVIVVQSKAPGAGTGHIYGGKCLLFILNLGGLTVA